MTVTRAFPVHVADESHGGLPPRQRAEMARARHGKLTDTYVESLTPREGRCERIVRDGALPGFLIRVGPRKRTLNFESRSPRR